MDLVTDAVLSSFALVMASIGLHEIGHLVPGKAFDVKTTEYFVGFGRTLWSRRKGETEYGEGGSGWRLCSLVGMFPPAKDNPDQIRAYSTGLFRALAGQCTGCRVVNDSARGRGPASFVRKPFGRS